MTVEKAPPVDPKRWLALAVVLVAAFMDLLDATIVFIAIPAIQGDLGADNSAIQWIGAGYALAFALGLITGGRLGDIFGRKKMFMIGVVGFTLASAVCGIAVDPGLLSGARVVQGAMAAVMVPQILAIIHVTFPAEERGKVFGMYGMIIGLAAVSGPLLGGVLVQADLFGLGWRPIFLVNVPVGIAGLYFGAKYITESKAPNALKLDLVGVVLATLGLLMLLYPLVQGHELGWPAWGYVSMIASIPVLAGFVAYERFKARRDGSPLVVLSLFRARTFASGLGVQLIFATAFGIFWLVWTLYMQVGLGWSALEAGLTGLPFFVGVAAASGVSVEMLVPKYGRKVLQAGGLLMIAGFGIYVWLANALGADIHSWQLALPLLLTGVGMGLVIAPLADLVLTDVPQQDAGSASGLISTTQQLGTAVGTALVSVVFFSVLGSGYLGAFTNALWWIIGALVIMSALMFALPRGIRATQPEKEQVAAH